MQCQSRLVNKTDFDFATNDRFQFYCHLDPDGYRERDLFVRRDLAPLIFNSPRALVEMTALMQLSVIFTLCPIKIGLQLSLTVTLSPDAYRERVLASDF
jgi:hypothetical protein